MEEVTILCCYNSDSDFRRFKETVLRQTIPAKIIGIDNRYNAYSSCAAAFNEALSQVHTKYVIFSHQDIELPASDLIESFVNCLKIIDDDDIVGVAGRDYTGSVLTNVLHGKDRKFAGKKRVQLLEECETVDECFFGGKTHAFLKYPFNQKICNNWHLYAVEWSLAAKTRGNKVYVCGIPMLHNSRGKINQIYNKQLYQLCKMYSKNIDYIYTTCASSSTKFPFREIKYIIRAISITLGRYNR